MYHPRDMESERSQPRRIGRYLLYGPIASGGMASVHLGRLLGEAGFSRTVAIKRILPQFADAPELAASLLDEARIVSRIQHPNVVPTIDLITDDDEAFLVMEYVRGESLARLLRGARSRGEKVPSGIVASIVCGFLHGLHAAHEALGESGEPLGIVHRDISPENVLVGVDGVPRLLDFGIAKARGRLSTTRGGQLKGKLAYMAPEQILCAEVSRRTDVYAAGIVLWEALTGQRLFDGPNEAVIIASALERPFTPPSVIAPEVPAALDAVVERALERNEAGRYPSARELAIAVEHAAPLASPRAVGEWVERLAGDVLAKRAERVSWIESASAGLPSSAERASRGPGADASTSLDASGDTEAGRASEETRAAFQPGEPRAASPIAVPPGPKSASGISLMLPSIAAPTISQRWAALSMGMALLVGGALALLLFLASRRGGLLDVSAGAAQAAAPGLSGSVEAKASEAALRTALPAAAPGASVLAAVSAAGPSPAASPASTIARPATPLVMSGRRPELAPRVSVYRCSPPYTVDKTGLRRLKPECM